MTLGKTNRIAFPVAFALTLCALFGALPASAQLPDLVIEVGNVEAGSEETGVTIPVQLTNFNHTIAGFNLWFQMDRPDLARFEGSFGTTIDTTYWECLLFDGPTCIDSAQTNPSGAWDFIHIDTNTIFIAAFDTTSTIISGWELVDARSLSGQGTDINVIAIADYFGGPTTEGFPPQTQPVTLIKLVANVLEVPDTLSDRTVSILVQYDFLDHFNFSDPQGNSIGLTFEEILDTNYYVCEQWAGEVCTEWQRVSLPPYDSLEVVTDSVAVVDTANVIVDNGSLTVTAGVCGDANDDGSVDPIDLAFMVDFLFAGGATPSPNADVNCDTSVDPIDLATFVDFLFAGGLGPCEGPGCD